MKRVLGVSVVLALLVCAGVAAADTGGLSVTVDPAENATVNEPTRFTATITAADDFAGGENETVYVTLHFGPRLTVDQQTLTISPGETKTINLTYTFSSAGRSQPLWVGAEYKNNQTFTTNSSQMVLNVTTESGEYITPGPGTCDKLRNAINSPCDWDGVEWSELIPDVSLPF